MTAEFIPDKIRVFHSTETMKLGKRFGDIGVITKIGDFPEGSEVCTNQYSGWPPTPNCPDCPLSPANGGDCPAAKES